jgi:hypothetical protein
MTTTKTKITTDKKIYTKKRKFLDELFENAYAQAAAKKKLDVSSYIYKRWLNDPQFEAEFNSSIKILLKDCEIQLAQFAPFAVKKLIDLTESEKDDLKLKAAIEILKMVNLFENAKNEELKDQYELGKDLETLSDEKASRILSVLVENPA